METNPDLSKFDATNLHSIQELKEAGPIHYIKILKDGRIALAVGNYSQGDVSIYKFKEDGKTLERTIYKEKLMERQINHVNELSDGNLTCCGSNNEWKLLKLTEKDLELLGTFKAKDDSGIIYQVQELSNGSIITTDDKWILKWQKSDDGKYTIEKEYQLSEACYQVFECIEENAADNYLILCLPNEEKIKFIKVSDFSEFKDKEIEKWDSCRWCQEIARLDVHKELLIVGTVDALQIINLKTKEALLSQDLSKKDDKMISAFETIPGTDILIASTEFTNNELKSYIVTMEFTGEELVVKTCSKDIVSPDLIRTIRLLKNGLVLIGGADDTLRVLDTK